MIDITVEHMKIIKDILKKYIVGYEVRAFGSRVNGTARRYSDLDLAIIGKTKLPKKILYLLREEFAESNLPFRVEIVDYQVVSDEFKRIVQDKGVKFVFR
ncbi:MAG: nucleotidyltransferase domain-containing protein [Candidatus Omnitrophota bacterium]